MSNVIELQVKPKSIRRQYKRQTIVVTYTPATKQWKWEVELTQVTKFSGVADTQMKAVRAGEKHIDGVLKVQGKEFG